jgi:hypothetical protein
LKAVLRIDETWVDSSMTFRNTGKDMEFNRWRTLLVGAIDSSFILGHTTIFYQESHWCSRVVSSTSGEYYG